MIGNDIVDLNLCKKESNWRRKGWLEKLFCSDELINIREASNPETLIWLYWSMKEAAYKIYNRQHGKILFEPSGLKCNLEQLTDVYAAGKIHYRDTKYHTESMINHLFIHTIARMDDSIYPSCISINNSKLQARLYTSFEFKKNEEGFPYLVNKNTNKTFIASKSHHGSFEAIVF